MTCQRLLGVRPPGSRFSPPIIHIPRHAGYTKGIVRCHLGLVVPKSSGRCEMEVEDTTLRWEVGKCVIFDDSRKHEVWNDTDEERIVLLLDVERPMKWPGHLALRTQHAILRFSPFLRDARRNLQDWEERVYRNDPTGAGPPAAL